MSVHTGTHTDSPFHISDAGATIAEMSLNPYVGQALVVDVQGKKVVRIADLEPMDLLPRLLLKTNSWRDYTRFPEQVPVLAEDVPGYLKERGVVLLGVDVPSVDTIESKDLPIHHQLTRHGITILESLYLREVPAGEYELIALPMKLDGADGAPVRAILRA
jgi:arylformamidase